jgi:hypothetical protein
VENLWKTWVQAGLRPRCAGKEANQKRAARLAQDDNPNSGWWLRDLERLTTNG